MTTFDDVLQIVLAKTSIPEERVEEIRGYVGGITDRIKSSCNVNRLFEPYADIEATPSKCNLFCRFRLYPDGQEHFFAISGIAPGEDMRIVYFSNIIRTEGENAVNNLLWYTKHEPKPYDLEAP